METNQFLTRSYDAKLQQLASYFDCGKPRINQFLRGPEALDSGKGKTYVYLSDDEKAIIGYYNISTAYLHIINEYGKVRAGGSAHICYFALDLKYQGMIQHTSDGERVIKLSDILLDDCLERLEMIRNKHIGFSFVTLAATAEGKNLYERNGFEEIEEDYGFAKDETERDCTKMYLPLDYE